MFGQGVADLQCHFGRAGQLGAVGVGQARHRRVRQLLAARVRGEQVEQPAHGVGDGDVHAGHRVTWITSDAAGSAGSSASPRVSRATTTATTVSRHIATTYSDTGTVESHDLSSATAISGATAPAAIDASW